MHLPFIWPRRSCREVTRLVLLSEDTGLPWHERLAVRLHMTVCDACPRFVRQVAFMRNAIGRWKAYAEGDGPDGAP